MQQIIELIPQVSLHNAFRLDIQNIARDLFGMLIDYIAIYNRPLLEETIKGLINKYQNLQQHLEVLYSLILIATNEIIILRQHYTNPEYFIILTDISHFILQEALKENNNSNYHNATSRQKTIIEFCYKSAFVFNCKFQIITFAKCSNNSLKKIIKTFGNGNIYLYFIEFNNALYGLYPDNYSDNLFNQLGANSLSVDYHCGHSIDANNYIAMQQIRNMKGCSVCTENFYEQDIGMITKAFGQNLPKTNCSVCGAENMGKVICQMCQFYHCLSCAGNNGRQYSCRACFYIGPRFTIEKPQYNQHLKTQVNPITPNPNYTNYPQGSSNHNLNWAHFPSPAPAQSPYPTLEKGDPIQYPPTNYEHLAKFSSTGQQHLSNSNKPDFIVSGESLKNNPLVNSNDLIKCQQCSNYFPSAKTNQNKLSSLCNFCSEDQKACCAKCKFDRTGKNIVTKKYYLCTTCDTCTQCRYPLDVNLSCKCSESKEIEKSQANQFKSKNNTGRLSRGGTISKEDFSNIIKNIDSKYIKQNCIQNCGNSLPDGHENCKFCDVCQGIKLISQCSACKKIIYSKKIDYPSYQNKGPEKECINCKQNLDDNHVNCEICIKCQQNQYLGICNKCRKLVYMKCDVENIITQTFGSLNSFFTEKTVRNQDN